MTTRVLRKRQKKVNKTKEEENAGAKFKFAELPYEIQVKVFSYLSKQDLTKSALVCKAWKNIAYDPSLWKDAVFPVRLEKAFNPATLFTFLKRSRMLRCLTLRCIPPNLDSDTLPSLPSLRHLDLGTCRSSRLNVAVKAFTTKCPMIETIVLECNRNLNDDAVNAVSELKNLKHLNLSTCPRVTSKCLQELVEKCNKLETLNIEGLINTDNSVVRAIGNNLNGTLKSLYLNSRQLTDAAFEELQKCKKLTVLSVGGADNVTDKSLDYIQTLTELTRLELRQWRSLTARGIKCFFTGHHLRNLVSLELKGLSIDDSGVINLAKCCPKLKLLYLPWCVEISEVGLEAIINGCKLLERLDISGLNKVTGACLSQLPSRGSQLKLLNAEGCDRMSDVVLDYLAENMPSLKILRYFEENYLTDSLEEEIWTSGSDSDDDDSWIVQVLMDRDHHI